MAPSSASGFLDRTSEREMLDRLLATAREGQSAVLVIRGEPGIGKTALLRYAARQASGFRVAQAAGVEAEMELPFSGIHQLCAPVLDQLDALAQPQQDALNVALGLAPGDVPDRFLVGLAALGLLSAAAEERPRAAEALAIDRSSLAPAEDAQLVEIGARVRFRHPLVRSAVYRAAAASERRNAHRALA